MGLAPFPFFMRLDRGFEPRCEFLAPKVLHCNTKRKEEFDLDFL
jgi:hypothetical protein